MKTENVVAIVAALLVLGAVGVILSTGGVPLLTQSDGVEDESVPTETPNAEPAPATEPSNTDPVPGMETPNSEPAPETEREATPAATTTPAEPFALSVESIEDCGQTCRDVTIALTNRQSTSASDVTVTSRIFAGNGTDGDVVWTGTESVGELEPGMTVRETERVELSVLDALAIQREDGWITVRATVQSENEATTFTVRRNVM